MRIRLALTLDIDRRRDAEPEFEHRDTDALAENSFGGDPATHRLGFTPAPDFENRKAA